MTSQTIDIGALSLEQLNQLKQQHEQEIQNYKAQHDDIRQLESRFRDARTALDVIADDPNAEGRSMLVPLTQSLYVAGEILDAGKVLVDIGTGYFVEQKVADAKKLINRRAELIAKNSANVTTVVSQKQRNLEAIMMMMQFKLQQIQDKKAAYDRQSA